MEEQSKGCSFLCILHIFYKNNSKKLDIITIDRGRKWCYNIVIRIQGIVIKGN